MADGRHFEKKDDAPGIGYTVKILNFPKSKMAAAAIMQKSQKSRYLRKGLTDLYEIWFAHAKWAS